MTTPIEAAEECERVSQPRSDEAGRLFEAGAENIERAHYGDALTDLSRAAELAPTHAQIRSLLGVAMAYEMRDFEQSRALCESAAKQEFFNPDLYLNLSRVYLLFGRRSEALRYLRRGRMIDPGHAKILRAISDLGLRKSPILPFLPRRHLVNRALGGARNLVMTSLTGR
jgi:tetratricopeptide (TPR) repeat protein